MPGALQKGGVGVGIVLNNQDKGKLRINRLDHVGWSPELESEKNGKRSRKDHPSIPHINPVRATNWLQM